MRVAPLPADEADRLKALRDLAILDTLPERNLDLLARLASELLNIPIVIVSLVDKERQWFKSCIGLEVQETPRDQAFCAHAILGDEMMVVEDALLDERFCDNPLVIGEPHVRFYAGVPIKGGGRYNLGTFCIISREPKKLSDQEKQRFKDLASLVEDELALRRALLVERNNQAQLLQAEKMSSIGLLASGFAHEINTPMQFVASNTAFIESGFHGVKTILEKILSLTSAPAPSESLLQNYTEIKQLAETLDLEYMLREVPEAISQTQEGIKRITELVVAMRDFSHVNAGDKTPEQLNDIIQKTVVLCQNSWKYKSRVKLDLATDLPLVECNSGEINQVLLNLIMNASQAINERIHSGIEGSGLIQIRSFAPNPTFVFIEVEDNGTGIDPSIRSKIFDPFFTTKPVGQGNGQGLAISYDIVVHKHGGRMEVDSSIEVGRTVFRVVLPIKATGATEQKAS